jgi:hypothetical protein
MREAAHVLLILVVGHSLHILPIAEFVEAMAGGAIELESPGRSVDYSRIQEAQTAV